MQMRYPEDIEMMLASYAPSFGSPQRPQTPSFVMHEENLVGGPELYYDRI